MWWRLGAVYAILMLVLGDAVWEGHIGAAVRAILPLILAFNIMLPRTAKALPLLILANALSFAGIAHLADKEPPLSAPRFVRSQDLNVNLSPKTFQPSQLQFENGWHDFESSGDDYWHWSSGTGIISYTIHRNEPLPARFRFQVRSISSRDISIRLNGVPVLSLDYQDPYISKQFEIKLHLLPGENEIEISSKASPDSVQNDSRKLAFALYNFQLQLEDSP